MIEIPEQEYILYSQLNTLDHIFTPHEIKRVSNETDIVLFNYSGDIILLGYKLVSSPTTPKFADMDCHLCKLDTFDSLRRC